MNNNFGVPSADIRIKMKHGNGGSFEEQKNKVKTTMYIISGAFLFFAVLMMLVMPVKTKMDCVYKTDAYDCSVHSKAMLRDLGATEYQNITHTSLETSRGKDGSMYQIQFVDINGQKISFSGHWTNAYGIIDRQVTALNKIFFKNKDFKYDFGTEKLWMAVIILFLIVPVLIYFNSDRLLNDYAYRQVGRNEYKAVLKGKGVGSIPQSEVISLTSGMFGHGKEQEKELVDLDEYAVKNAKARKPKNPKQLSDEELANLQDDELTDMQKDFYDRNN